jgi:hypothetical protein
VHTRTQAHTGKCPLSYSLSLSLSPPCLSLHRERCEALDNINDPQEAFARVDQLQRQIQQTVTGPLLTPRPSGLQDSLHEQELADRGCVQDRKKRDFTTAFTASIWDTAVSLASADEVCVCMGGGGLKFQQELIVRKDGHLLHTIHTSSSLLLLLSVSFIPIGFLVTFCMYACIHARTNVCMYPCSIPTQESSL